MMYNELMPRILLIAIPALAITFPVWIPNYQVVFIPTKKRHLDILKDQLAFSKDDVIFDLGSGLGGVLRYFLEGNEARGRGIELSPTLFFISKLLCYQNRRIKISFGDFFKKNLSEATVVFCFLTPKVLDKLSQQLISRLNPGTKVISYLFPLTDFTPTSTFKDRGITFAYMYII